MILLCKFCGKPFKRGGNRQLYCSHEHMQRRYRISPKGRLGHRMAALRYYYRHVSSNPMPVVLALADSLHRDNVAAVEA